MGSAQFTMSKVENKVVPPKFAKCDPSENFCGPECICLGCSKFNCCSRHAKKKGVDCAKEIALDKSLDDAINKLIRKQTIEIPAPVTN